MEAFISHLRSAAKNLLFFRGGHRRLCFPAGRCVFLLALLSAILLFDPRPAVAQSQSPAYWRYPASGRLQHTTLADVNHDGIEELLVVAENGKVDLLGADGQREWSYTSQDPIQAIGTVNVDGPSQPELETVLSTSRQLVLLSAQGAELRRVNLVPFSAPPALLTNGGEESAAAWQERHQVTPVTVAPFDHDNDGREEILVLFQSGQLQLYDATGAWLWSYVKNSKPLSNTEPRIAIGDVDQDGQKEIVLGFYIPRRFSQLALIEGNGQASWDRPVEGRIRAMTLVAFAGQTEQHIAVGTNLGHINLYNKDRQRVWLRTLNKPVTSLAPVNLLNRTVLAAGTEVGTVVAFTEEGRRLWTNRLAPQPDRRIVALSPASFAAKEGQPVLSVIIGPRDNDEGPIDVMLLGHTGRILETFPVIDTSGLTRLTDINGDQKSELLLVRFATVELLGLGFGASENAKEWGEDYFLRAKPTSYLVVDFNRDGEDELLIGAQDGRLHRLGNDKSIHWLLGPNAPVTHLAALPHSPTEPPNIVVVRNDSYFDQNDEKVFASWIELIQANSNSIWTESLSRQITSLLVANINNQGKSEIVVGTNTGEVIAYSTTGANLWQKSVGDSVQQLLVLEGQDMNSLELIAVTTDSILKMTADGPPENIGPSPPQKIHTAYAVHQPGGELAVSLLVFMQDGTVHGINRNGFPLLHLPWPLRLPGSPTVSLPTAPQNTATLDDNMAESFLIASNANALLRLSLAENQPSISRLLPETEAITSLFWGDLDGDALPDIAAGDREGVVRLYTREPQKWDELDLGSSVFALTGLKREAGQKSDLLVVTENGRVQLFRAQPNRPPLLTNPEINVAEGQYSFSISVRDVERDTLTARLDLYDPESGNWIPQEEKRFDNGNGKEVWLVNNPPATAEGVRYRFYYNDNGFHEGYLTLPLGPVPIPVAAPATESVFVMSLLGLFGLVAIVLVIRQTQLPTSRARRFYRQLRQQPTQSLVLLENKYKETYGSPDLLLNLASRARSGGDRLLAGLADGLFLLEDRPHAGLAIITGVLDEIVELAPPWQAAVHWQMTYQTGQTLLEAPSIVELSLLRPQLVQLLATLEEHNRASPVLNALLPILTNLRDSERVELAEDRLVYLNEANILLNRLQAQLPEFAETIEKTLVAAIIKRWSGLVSAEIEELRGRAELAVTLKTKRLVPNGHTDVALEIRNNGRAPAENIIAILDEHSAYQVHSPPETIPFLPPGRTRQVQFTIDPQVLDRFRIALTVTYDDRNRRHKTVAFGDMVHLLPPIREFKPVANPYLPGTPLRRNSIVFFGREELFSFITENVDHASQRNVLILVGQRRTGKTSVLLRLDEHLPSYLLPVYIDCQSLGVTPGMASLLHELAWHVADALTTRGIELDVPELASWQEDPTGHFQRHFLPEVKSLLPDNTTLLLVFDEFEAFENLVEDGILPSTIFPYMRHLMQHSTGLSFIFVGTRRLEEMSADYWSVLFNIALYRKIGYLSKEAATRLIREPVAPNLIYDDLAIDKILRVTDGHPYFLQLVCYTLVKRANAQRSSYITISDVNSALDEMLRLGEVHFAYLWQRSTFTERALLAALAHLMDRDSLFHPEELMEYLKPYDIELSPAEVTAALNHLVERDILQEVTEGAVTLYELRIALVGLWVAQHKSLSKLLYESNENGKQSALVVRKV